MLQAAPEQLWLSLVQALCTAAAAGAGEAAAQEAMQQLSTIMGAALRLPTALVALEGLGLLLKSPSFPKEGQPHTPNFTSAGRDGHATCDPAPGQLQILSAI